MAERCGFFIIIALGESILITGVTLSKLLWNVETLLAFLISFMGTVAMWWIYFEITSKIGHHFLLHSSDPGRLARWAYTYTHLLLTASIVLSAVADEMLLAHPTGHVNGGAALVFLGAPALYLFSNMMFIRIVSRTWSTPLAIGLFAIAILGLFGFTMSPLILTAASLIILIAVCIWGRTFSKQISIPDPDHS